VESWQPRPIQDLVWGRQEVRQGPFSGPCGALGCSTVGIQPTVCLSSLARSPRRSPHSV